MNLEDAYKELGLQPGTSQDECRKSYRRLISEWHPDRNGSDAAHLRSQQINRAWHVLEKAGFPGPGCFQAKSSTFHQDHDQSDPFGTEDDIYGASGFRGYRTADGYAYGAKQGKHIKRTARVSLEEANNGFIYEFEATVKDPCGTCGGEKSVGQPMHCDACRGRGFTGTNYYNRYACSKCDGHGRFLRACGACHGTGVAAQREVKQQIRIRPGMRSGDTMIVRGLGGKSPDRHGPNGDLTIGVTIKDHPIFHFDDAADGMLCVVVPITMLDLMCGGNVDVPTLYGMKTITATLNQLTYEIKDAGYNGLKGREPLRVKLDLDVEPLPEKYRDILYGAREYMRKSGMPESEDVLAWKAEVAEWMNPTKPTKKTTRKKTAST
jgi:molecular chaperone DnaJ